MMTWFSEETKEQYKKLKENSPVDPFKLHKHISMNSCFNEKEVIESIENGINFILLNHERLLEKCYNCERKKCNYDN